MTFNGNSFDLPVLRYRAMTQGVAAPGLSARPYFNGYTDDAIDLCDVLFSFAQQAKAALHEVCKVMGMSGKPDSIDGSEVTRYFLEGKIRCWRRSSLSTRIRWVWLVMAFLHA